MLTQVGTTKDGRTVVRGVFRLYETEGLPLDVIFDSLLANQALPDWTHFMLEAELAGMKRTRILSMLDVAISDTFGSSFRDVVIQRLSKVFQ